MDRNLRGSFMNSDYYVALRKESVDRNQLDELPKQSLLVALRKESVDRNKVILTAVGSACCRSPQGERG